jgi:hypothetical protein
MHRHPAVSHTAQASWSVGWSGRSFNGRSMAGESTAEGCVQHLLLCRSVVRVNLRVD